MYRLLVVDDEEIITNSLYEVFHQWMPENLDVCRAYSGKEALNWMSRTRIDIVLTDIRMPGMSGLELTESIRALWPRCRIIFLTGYSDFDYAYQAIQMPNVRYLLKTEGFDKVMEVVKEVIHEIESGHRMNEWLMQSRVQTEALEWMEQGEYFRQFVADSSLLGQDKEAMRSDFRALNIGLDPELPVLLALGRVAYSAGKAYVEKKNDHRSVRLIWNSFMDEHVRSIGVLDKHGDLLWMLQPRSENPSVDRLVIYSEGTLELIQEACLDSLGLAISFTISGNPCRWEDVTPQYERLRRLQQLKMGNGIPMILKDQVDSSQAPHCKEGVETSHKAGILEAHLEAGRENEFMKELEQLSEFVLNGEDHHQHAAQAYYSIALVLYAKLTRLELQDPTGERGKLLDLESHDSMKEAFRYLRRTAEDIFDFKRLDERGKTAHVIDRLCQYIEEHLDQDITLVHLAERYFFNPSYLSRLFKQERGINLSEYIEKCRIRRAKELLKEGDLKVRDVAPLVGYDAAHSFTRFFKKATGLTPQEYRDHLAK
ncbi:MULTISPECIES: response regulator [Paenibacillus]|uniref:DNA-binding response regulator n=1 Tax=Paenibacillus campinasensis TaxID=66347 RepID=A0A268F1H7_9BACL|nr:MULTISPECIES: response regulator [Paenibacillus]PAD79235.1 DNA-binding response regulator [Paenibacillus campinasensis]PAK54229.1 DNA-binding response regulator [Paenibacillus sp. 7541]